MNLVALAIRIVVTKLLTDRTWAEKRVFDSPLDPIAEVLTSASASPGQTIGPCIAVYTADAKTSVPDAQQTQGSKHDIDLTIYSYLPPTFRVLVPGVPVQPPDGEQPVAPGEVMLEVQNAASAIALDFVARQVQNAIKFGPAPWANLWNTFVVTVDGIESRGVLAQPEKGIQIPCQEAKWSLTTVPDPDFGRALYGGWLALYNAMLTDAELAPFAPALKQLIEAPDGLPSWRQAQALLGIGPEAIRSIGLAPFDPTEPGEPAELADVGVDGDIVLGDAVFP